MTLQNAINRQDRQQFFRSGNYYSLAIAQSAHATLAHIANTLRVWPWIISEPVILNEVRLEVTTLIAASIIRMGLYSDNGAIYPGSLIISSDFDAATTGVKTVSFAGSPITLKPGLYWLATNSNAAPLCRSVAVAAIAPVLGVSASMGTNGGNTNFSIAQAFGALPATFPGGAATQTNNTAPAAIWRAV